MIDSLAEYLRQPLKIGGQSIDTRLVLAPMSFLGHIAFRELVSRYGGYGLLFSEMCSAKAIPNENRFVSPYFRWRDEERSLLICQIFGDDPPIMAAAARRVENEGLFGVDINLGCSNATICRRNCTCSGAGSCRRRRAAGRGTSTSSSSMSPTSRWPRARATCPPTPRS